MDDAEGVASQLAGLGYLVRVLLAERLARMSREERETFVAEIRPSLPSPAGAQAAAFIDQILDEAMATAAEARHRGGQPEP